MKIIPYTYEINADPSQCISGSKECAGPLSAIGNYVCLECSIQFDKLLFLETPKAVALKKELDEPVSELDKQFGKLFER